MIKVISFIFKHPFLNHDEFVSHYENIHAPLASTILEFYGYERNHIINCHNRKNSPSCISVFRYKNEEQLKKTQDILSDYPPELKEDELKFMAFDKNYYHFVEEKLLNSENFPIKIFAYQKQVRSELKLLSVNTDKTNKFRIYEYGIKLQDQYPDYKGEVFICKTTVN